MSESTVINCKVGTMEPAGVPLTQASEFAGRRSAVITLDGVTPMRVADLPRGFALDCAIARALGVEVQIRQAGDMPAELLAVASGLRYSPSTSWTLGGPVIEALGVDLMAPTPDLAAWMARVPSGVEYVALQGATALEAAMRAVAYVRLGDTVTLP